ncbi:MAG: hypothetical protein LBL82_01925 [Oscillospiraceae bacterium]|jgi:hypothetical protein|nr:hypothetical protein [Oscillospiraceae bacterium]
MSNKMTTGMRVGRSVSCVVLTLALILGCSCTYKLGNTAPSEPPATYVQEEWQAVSDSDSGEDISKKFPLYASLPEDDFYLYGILPYGMVLYHDGIGQYFDWSGITPRQVMPEMSYYDYDGDGEKELAVTVYWGSGTGVAMMDLHILKQEPQEEGFPTRYRDYVLSSEYSEVDGESDLSKLLNETFPMTLSEDGKTVNFTMDGKPYSTENERDEKLSEIVLSYIVHFFLNDDNSISVMIGIGLKYEQSAMPSVFAYVVADVSFDGENFSLSNKRLVYDDEVDSLWELP